MEMDAAVGASRNACYGPPEGRLEPLCVEAAIPDQRRPDAP